MARADIRAGRAFVELFLKNTSLIRGLRQSQQHLRQFGGDIQALGRVMATASAAMALPMGLSVKRFREFDDKMREVRAVGELTGEEFDRLSKKAKNLGATTSFTAVEVAGLMAELARAGFDASQVEDMTGAVLDLARASATDATLASGIMAASIRQFGLGAKDATRVADALTAAANKSFNSVESLGESLSYAGPVAHDFGMSIEETVALLGTLGNVGILGSNAGTAMRRLLTLTGAEAAKMKEIFGVSFVDAAGNARPLVDSLEDVAKATANLGTAARAEKFNEAFGLLGITGASAISRNVTSTRELLKAIEAAGGVAAATAKEMDGGIGGSFRMMWSAVEGLGIAIGEALSKEVMRFADAVTGLTSRVIKFVESNSELIVTVAKVTAGIGLAGASLFAFGASMVIASKAIGFGLVAMGAFGGALSAATLLFAPFTASAALMSRGVRGGFAAARVSLMSFVSALGKSATIFGGMMRRMAVAAVAGAAQVAGSLHGMAVSGVARASAAIASLGPVLATIPARANEAFRKARELSSWFAAGFRGDIVLAVGGAREAFHTFGEAVRYALTRPADYAKALAPKITASLRTAFDRAASFGSAAAQRIQAEWSRASSLVATKTAAAVASITSRWNSLTTSLAARFTQAGNSISTGFTARVAAGMAAVSSAAKFAADKTRGVWGPIAAAIQGPLMRIAPLVKQDWAKLISAARITSRGIVAAFATAGPAIASGLTTAARGAFSRILAMGRATAAGLARGVGGIGRGLGGALGGVGMLASLAGPLLGSLGTILMTAPLVVSALGSIAAGALALMTPFGLVAAAIVGGTAAWAKFSESGRSAFASLSKAVGPVLDTIRKTIGGVMDALQSGDFAKAGEIAMAALRAAMLQGIASLSDAMTANFKPFLDAIIGGWDIISTMWDTVVSGLSSLWSSFTDLASGLFGGVIDHWFGGLSDMGEGWSAFAEGLVAVFTQAMRAVTDLWQKTTTAIANFILDDAANGGLIGTAALMGTGIDVKAEQQKGGMLDKERRKVLKQGIADRERAIVEAQARGDEEEVEALRGEIASLQESLGVVVPDFLASAKSDAAAQIKGQADAFRGKLDELDQRAQARTRESAPVPGTVSAAQSAADKAKAELESLLAKQAAEKEAAKQADEAKLAAGKEPVSPFGNIPGAAQLSQRVAGSFSAAALVAQGGGGRSPQERMAKGIDELVREAKDAARAAQKQMRILERMGFIA